MFRIELYNDLVAQKGGNGSLRSMNTTDRLESNGLVTFSRTGLSLRATLAALRCPRDTSVLQC